MRKNRLLSVLLSLVLVLSMLPMTVSAAAPEAGGTPAAAVGAVTLYADYGSGFEFLSELYFTKNVTEQTVEVNAPIKALRVVKGECLELDLDCLTLNGKAPEGFERKLSAKDNDLIEVEDFADFVLEGEGELLIAARAPKALKGEEYSFKFPSLEGLEAVPSGEYYAYVPGSRSGSFSDGELVVPGESYLFVSEMCHPDSGHPDAPMDIYLADDGETLYVFFEAFLDNTFDHGKDFAAVHVKGAKDEKIYKVHTTEENENGCWWFEYTDSSDVYDWQHMCYVVELPMVELETEDGTLALSFEYYGTSYGGAELQKLGIGEDFFVSQSYMDLQNEYEQSYGYENRYKDCPILPAVGETVNSEGGNTAEGAWWLTAYESESEEFTLGGEESGPQYILTLNGAVIDKKNELSDAPLHIYGNLIIELAEGTENTLSWNDVDSPEHSLQYEGQELIIKGAGTLNVTGSTRSSAFAGWGQFIGIVDGAQVNVSQEATAYGSSYTENYYAMSANYLVVDGASLSSRTDITAPSGTDTPIRVIGISCYDELTVGDSAVIEVYASGAANGEQNIGLSADDYYIEGILLSQKEGDGPDTAEEKEDLRNTYSGTYGYAFWSMPYVRIETLKTYPLWVADTQVTILNAEDLSGIEGVEGEASYDPETNTLCLENASISTPRRNTSGISGSYDSMGVIYAGNDDFTISVSGECSIGISDEVESVRSIGFLIGNKTVLSDGIGQETEKSDFDVNIELAEGAVLTIKGGDVTNYGDISAMETVGLRSNSVGLMTVSGAGTLDLSGGAGGEQSMAVMAYGDLTVEEGVTMNCTALDGSSSIALGVQGDLTIDGAVVKAEACTGQFSAAVYVMGNIDLEDGELSAVGSDAIYVGCGIGLGGMLTVNGGKLTAETGKLIAEGEAAGHGNSAGISMMKFAVRPGEEAEEREQGITINGGYVEVKTLADPESGVVRALEAVPVLGEGVTAAASEDSEGEDLEEYDPEKNEDYRWFRVPFDVEFTVTFVNEDGEVLYTVEVPYGEMPVYEGEEPTKDEDDDYTYEFTGWDPELAEATEDATYTAVFEATEKEPEEIEEPAALYTIKVSGGTADKDEAEEGETVTITADSKSGYTFKQWKVATGGALDLNETAKKTSFTMPAHDVELEAEFKKKSSSSGGGEGVSSEPAAKPRHPFVDVAKTAWYDDAVQWAWENKVTDGVDDTHFAPNSTATRAQMVTFLWRVAGSPKAGIRETPFEDIVKGSWYYDAVLWAYEKGITDGTSETHFSPSLPVTRSMVAAFLYRYEKSIGGGFKDLWAFELDYPDVEDVPEYAYEPFCWLVKEGVIEGSNGRLIPLEPCLRSQIVTMMYRYFSL